MDDLESDNQGENGHCIFNRGPNGPCGNQPPYIACPAAAEDDQTFTSQWIDKAALHGFKPLIGNINVSQTRRATGPPLGSTP